MELINSVISVDYLKNKAPGGIYLNLLKQITKSARTLKVSVSPEFGIKPVVKKMNIVDTAVSAGTFKVIFFLNPVGIQYRLIFFVDSVDFSCCSNCRRSGGDP